MRPFHKILVCTGPCVLVGMQIVFMTLLAAPDGARIRAPEESSVLDRGVDVAGDAWMAGGIVSIVVVASPAGPAAVGPVRAEAARDTVKYRGAPLYPLSTWTAHMELPAPGPWGLQAVAAAKDGAEVRSAVRGVRVVPGTAASGFRGWSVQHLAALAAVLVLAAGLVFLARRPGAYDGVALAVTASSWLNEIVYQIYWFRADGWSASSALVVQMCGLSILLLPLAHFLRAPKARQWLFDVLYFWGIEGAVQALIAPDIGANGFPTFRYFAFFIAHGLIVGSASVLAAAGGMRITVRSLVRAFLATNAALIPAYAVDRALHLIPPYDVGNYFVLGYPPPTGSMVDAFSDIFGPAPRYLAGLELMGLAVFLVLYAPWPVQRFLARRRAGPAAPTASL